MFWVNSITCPTNVSHILSLKLKIIYSTPINWYSCIGVNTYTPHDYTHISPITTAVLTRYWEGTFTLLWAISIYRNKNVKRNSNGEFRGSRVISKYMTFKTESRSSCTNKILLFTISLTGHANASLRVESFCVCYFYQNHLTRLRKHKLWWKLISSSIFPFFCWQSVRFSWYSSTFCCLW